MIIPFGTDRPLKRPTKITYALVALNIFIYLVGAIWGSPRVDPDGWDQIYRALWFDPMHVTPWGLITYQFLHAGFLHLLFNMLFLWVFGPNVEDRLGRVGFLAFYLVGGVIAGATHWLFEGFTIDGAPGQVFAPRVVGASGSIAAVTGAYIVLFPKTHIRVFIMFFFIGVFHLPAVFLIGFAIFRDLIYQGLGAGDGVARLAHLGGYGFGAGVAFTLLATGLLAREPFDLFSLGKQAHRRRVFRELTTKGNAAWSSDLPKTAPVRTDRKSKSGDRASKVAARRTQIHRSMRAGELDEAARLYLKLLDEEGEAALPRADQYDLANHFLATGQHERAAIAYETFLGKHPRDHEAPRVRLLLALINARYLNDPIRAKALLEEIGSAPLDGEQTLLARTLREELG